MKSYSYLLLSLSLMHWINCDSYRNESVTEILLGSFTEQASAQFLMKSLDIKIQKSNSLALSNF